MKRFMMAVILIAVAGGSLAATTAKKAHPAMKMPDHGLVTPNDMQWGPAPPVFQAGAEMAVLQGNPGSAGPYTVRLKMSDGYKIMPHWHPTTENVTVISGTFHLGTGGTFDDTKGSEMPAGSFGFTDHACAIMRGRRARRSCKCTAWDRSSSSTSIRPTIRPSRPQSSRTGTTARGG